MIARLRAWWGSSPRWQEAIWTIGAGLFSFLSASWVLRLWDAPLRVPFVPNGDSLLGFVAIKSMLENGWYLFNPSLGAPHGQQLYDFGALGGDMTQWVALRVIGFVVTDPVVLMNAYFLLGFAAVGALSYLVLRSIGARRLTSLMLSMLIAVLPYHFTQSEGHLMLANYVAVPATCWLVLRVLTGRPLVTRSARTGITRFATWTNAAVIGACILAGATSIYYAVFALLLLAMAGALRALSTWSRRGLGGAAYAWVVVVIALFITFIPALIYRFANGPNPVAATRLPLESDTYSFGLGQLLFSSWGSRIPFLADIGNRYLTNSVNAADPDTQLGLVLGGTFVVSLAVLIALTLRGRWPAGPRSTTIRAASVGAVLVFLIGSFGGIGSIIAHLVTPQIRVWTRITPYLAFFAAVVLALAIDWARARVRRRRGGYAVALALPVLAGAIGLYDQTSPNSAPDYAANSAVWNTTKQFVQQIERALPANSMILQLPLHAFPEAGNVNDMGDYDHLFGYAHSTTLRWSYGAMKGRPDDWAAVAQSDPLPLRTIVINATAAGFRGVWVDRAAYADRGAGVEATIASLTGPQTPIVSGDGRLAFYDLQPLLTRLNRTYSPSRIARAGKALVSPTAVEYGPGFQGEERGPAGARWRWATRDATLVLQNPTTAHRTIVWSGTFTASPGAHVRVAEDGRLLYSRTLNSGRAAFRIPLTSPPGTATVRVTSDGANQAPASDPRTLNLNLAQPTTVDSSLITVP